MKTVRYYDKFQRKSETETYILGYIGSGGFTRRGNGWVHPGLYKYV